MKLKPVKGVCVVTTTIRSGYETLKAPLCVERPTNGVVDSCLVRGLIFFHRFFSRDRLCSLFRRIHCGTWTFAFATRRRSWGNKSRTGTPQPGATHTESDVAITFLGTGSIGDTRLKRYFLSCHLEWMLWISRLKVIFRYHLGHFSTFYTSFYWKSCF